MGAPRRLAPHLAYGSLRGDGAFTARTTTYHHASLMLGALIITLYQPLVFYHMNLYIFWWARTEVGLRTTLDTNVSPADI